MTCSIGAFAASEHCCTPGQALIAKIKINYLLLSILMECIQLFMGLVEIRMHVTLPKKSLSLSFDYLKHIGRDKTDPGF